MLNFRNVIFGMPDDDESKQMLIRSNMVSLSKFKDFSRTSKDYPKSFQGLKVYKNPDISIKILLQKC